MAESARARDFHACTRKKRGRKKKKKELLLIFNSIFYRGGTIEPPANCNLSNLDLHRHTLRHGTRLFQEFIHRQRFFFLYTFASRQNAARDVKLCGSSPESKGILETVVVTSGTIDETSCRRLPTLRRSQARSSPCRFLGNNYASWLVITNRSSGIVGTFVYV